MLGISTAPANIKRVTVAVLDSGIAHDILSDPSVSSHTNITSTANFVDPESSTAAIDDNGHGTVVSLIISDVAPNVRLAIYKVVDASGRANEWNTLSAITACSIANVDVINMSLQFGLNDRTCGPCGRQSESLRSAIFSSMIRQTSTDTFGPVFVAPAGNAKLPAPPDNKLAFPSRFADVLAIGAINSRWELSSFSCYGSTDQDGNTHQNHYVLPGGEPNGELVESVGSFGPGGQPQYGTSFAAAYATATVAHLLARQGAYGGVRPPDFLQRLRNQVDNSHFANPPDTDKFGKGVLRV